jgi:hypothetical protein
MCQASADTSQQFVDVLRLKTTSTGDRHPSILFENNRSSVANALKLCMDSTDSAGTGEFTLRIKDSGGTFNTRLNISNNGNLLFNSGYGSVAVAYGCRAWVSFNSDGSIRAGGNVSSVSVVNSSSYNVNLTTAMPDTNYSVQWTVNVETNHFAIINSTSQINCRSGGSFSIGYMAIFR